MDRRQIIIMMEKTHKKLVLYSKKSKSMGLDTTELEKYIDMMVKYIKLKMQLNDSIFNDFVMPTILNGRAYDLYNEITSELNWNGDLLIEDDVIEKVLEKFEIIEDKEDLIMRINRLRDLLFENLNSFYEETLDKEMLEEISLLLSEGVSSEFEIILEHLDKKFEIMIKVLKIKEENSSEEVDKES